MIQNGKVVGLIYSLKNTEGEILDEADAKDPFTYLHGSQQIVVGLENALAGLNIGDRKKVTVSPEDGYGIHNPELKKVISQSQFPKDVEVEEGMLFQASTEDGEGLVFTIESIVGEDVHVDGNHPLAGQTLHFEVEVLTIRDATEEEIVHGHAHGPHGHDHDHSHGHEHDHSHNPDDSGHHSATCEHGHE